MANLKKRDMIAKVINERTNIFVNPETIKKLDSATPGVKVYAVQYKDSTILCRATKDGKFMVKRTIW